MKFIPSLSSVGLFFKQMATVAVTLLLTNSLWALPVWAQAASSAATASAATALSPESLSSESFVANAVRSVGDAVVRIDTERTVTRNVPDMFYDDPFFRGRMGGGGFQSIPQEEHLRGQGSGFIINDQGDILTNAHVVNNADQVTVKLKDGRQFEGYVEGVDEITDLAVIRIDTVDEPLPVSTLGDSDSVEVGDWAIAVGNPLGLDNTVTLGIVSTLKRSSAAVGIPDKRIDFIQTDAAINPGNSGGPLLNAQGEVIGINTAIRADAMGIGFAIPINKAKAIQASLSRGERIAHPYLGVQIATLTPDMAKVNNEDPNSAIELPETDGVLVVRVLPNTPAAEAGLRRGDVITNVAGFRVKQADQLQSRVDQVKVGDSLQMTLRRGDRTQQLSVKTADLSEQESA
ncbi:HhoA/HhoB/HtrA family serine endopeptidase [cf. Phormidesmis sp. LEGE 11477]|uniref:HhoA/HhoB/HtrA family serine endopeptidase n=1 Tax=cf. Phormidesmis sp. LEGE 11477 TaxID=1828680 RepID=UPI00187F9A28|nr:HhoA/HhoB/HtrA family serine endopeptidase [cf. Phormidesmis sp. LEGE 11477]MBE9059887.1 trypsin-like peptidase domain-containing protein [cf. Phormidesmis sp. LEGE 11477]